MRRHEGALIIPIDEIGYRQGGGEKQDDEDGQNGEEIAQGRMG